MIPTHIELSQIPTAFELLLISVAVKSLLLLNDVANGSSSNSSTYTHDPTDTLQRIKRRTQPQSGFFFPIAMYTVRHHKPAATRGRNVRPETWEYRGQYFYGYKPKANSGRRQAARLLAAGLPLLLAPLLSIIFSFPVLIPVAQTTTVTTGGTTLNSPLRPPWIGKRKRRRRRRRQVRHPMRHEQQQQKDKANKMRELEVVANYLHQVDYNEKQQSRVMVNYLQCNGLLSADDHCLERLSCEFADPANQNAPELERSVTSILLGHMLNNEFIPAPFKKRLKTAAVYGRKNSGKCDKYFCNYVDNDWDYTSVYPQETLKVPLAPQKVQKPLSSTGPLIPIQPPPFKSSPGAG